MDMQSVLKAVADGDVLDTQAVQSRLANQPTGDAAKQLFGVEEESQLLVDLG